ncbi:MAG: Flp pilus assembly protein CpaB [Planctomycetota bacterium]|nr:Flp pilus assembly protein CpaB [Planctomycetota bacterium]
MRSKSLYLILAGVCGIAAAAIASQYLSAQANSKPVGVLTEIFVAAVAIDVGEEITAQKVQLEKWPADKIPQGASGLLNEMEGKFAKQRFYVGEAIMPVKLMDDNWSAVRKGYKAVAMKASEVDIANLIQPGDRVDVMAYFSKSELIPRSTTKTVLQGVRVYALDGDTQRRSNEDRSKGIRTIELLINEKDAEAWMYANELGNIRLSLGSQEEFEGNELPNETGAEFLNWIEMQQQRLEEEIVARQRKIRDELAAREQRSLSRATLAPEKVGPAPEDNSSITSNVEDQGFSMVKMVEGKLLEYWVMPGKLPVLRGPVNPETQPMARPKKSNPLVDTTEERKSVESSDFTFLDGRQSPFDPGSNAGGFKINGK